jgi:hypothetical protein
MNTLNVIKNPEDDDDPDPPSTPGAYGSVEKVVNN